MQKLWKLSLKQQFLKLKEFFSKFEKQGITYVFLDDIRDFRPYVTLFPKNVSDFRVIGMDAVLREKKSDKILLVKNSQEFSQLMDLISDQKIHVDFISYDHDLGDGDVTEVFGTKFNPVIGIEGLQNKMKKIPYIIHSANPVGRANIMHYLGESRNVYL